VFAEVKEGMAPSTREPRAVPTEHPLVGVVVPAKDIGLWLDPMLTSLRAQTFTRWAAVVVDDGSSDDTVEIAQRHAADDSRISVVSNPHEGPGARLARIHGASLLPDVDYLYFPDGDDVLDLRLLERVAGRLEARPNAVAAFCGFVAIGESGEPLPGPGYERFALSRLWVRALDDADEETPFPTLYAETPAWEALTMFRRTAYDEAGGLELSPAWVSHTALDLLLRMSSLGAVVYVPDRLYHRRHRYGQASSNGALLAANGRALRALWTERADADPELRRLLEHGDFLFRHRATPRRRLARAAAYARRGNLVAAAPRIVLAALEYRWRIPPALRESVR
jgi:glycosyltransferase involved in cell wall biosynthesis